MVSQSDNVIVEVDGCIFAVVLGTSSAEMVLVHSCLLRLQVYLLQTLCICYGADNSLVVLVYGYFPLWLLMASGGFVVVS